MFNCFDFENKIEIYPKIKMFLTLAPKVARPSGHLTADICKGFATSATVDVKYQQTLCEILFCEKGK